MTPSCSEIRDWSCWLSNDVGLSIFHFHVYISGRQISIEFTVSFFLIPKNLQGFFWVPFGHQTTKTRVGGTEFPKSFPLSSTGNSTVFRVFLRSCPKELGYQESCPEDGSQLTKNGSQLLWHLCERKKSEDTLNKKQVSFFLFGMFTKYDFDSSGSDG